MFFAADKDFSRLQIPTAWNLRCAFLAILACVAVAGCKPEASSSVSEMSPKLNPQVVVAEPESDPNPDSQPKTCGERWKLTSPPEPFVGPRPWRILVPDKEFSVVPGTDVLRVTFADFNLEEIMAMRQIPPDAVERCPDWLKQLDGKRIRISGFMFPTPERKGLKFFQLIRELQIMNFGSPIRLDEKIPVVLNVNETTDCIFNREFDVEGVFRIDPFIDEGELFELYRIEEAHVIVHN